MRDFKTFMSQTKEMNRWFVSLVFLTGMFAGAIIATLWSLLAVVK